MGGAARNRFVERLIRWRGALTTATVGVVATVALARLALGLAPPIGWAMAVTAVGAAVATLLALRHDLVAAAMSRAPGIGHGAVLIEEGRILYLGPAGARAVDLDEIVRIDLAIAANGAAWMLTPVDSPPVAVPLTAENANALPAGLARLPGFSAVTAARLAIRNQQGMFTIWSRRGHDVGRAGPLASPRSGA